MKIHSPTRQRERWLARALCRRYAAVVFRTMSVPTLTNPPAKNRTISWAFGCLVKGEAEILGAWDLEFGQATASEMFGDLHDRGVEFIRFGLGNLAGAEASFLTTFRTAMLYPSIGQTLEDLLQKVRPFHRPAMSRLLRRILGELPEERVTVASLRFSSEDLRQKYPGILEQWGESVSAFQPLFSLPQPYRQLVRSVDRSATAIQERLMKAIPHHGPFEEAARAFDFVVDRLVRADLHLQDAGTQQLARVPRVSQSGFMAPVASGVAGTPALA